MAQFDLFISYSSLDRPWALKLKTALEQRGLKIWMDTAQIQPGEVFVNALERGLDRSRCVGLVVSPESVQSGWVQEEYARALSLVHPAGPLERIIPIVLRETRVPGFLANRHRVDFQEESTWDASIDALVWGITGRKPVGRASQAQKTRAILDRRLVADLIVAVSRPSDARRVDSAAMYSILYACGLFGSVFVENHFGSLLYSTIRADNTNLLSEVLLVVPAETAPIEPVIVESAARASILWQEDPGFYEVATRYGRAKGGLIEDVASCIDYVRRMLLLARSVDGAIIPHPARWPVYEYIFENTLAVARIGATLTDSPWAAAESRFPKRARPIRELAANSLPADATATLVRFGPLEYPTPPKSTKHSMTGSANAGSPFVYEFCVAGLSDNAEST
jgi:hypothetical protein